MPDAPSTYEGSPKPLTTATTVTAAIVNRRPLLSGSGFTWTSATMTLSMTGAFAGMSFDVFDPIYIKSGGTVGYARVNTATAPTDDAIVLVDSLGSNSANVELIHGIAPFTLVLEAGSTSDGTTEPWEDLQHKWTVKQGGVAVTSGISIRMWNGDTGAYETFDLTNGGQYGLKACIVFSKAGTYDIELESTAWTGSATITDTDTLTVTIEEHPETNDKKKWFDSSAGASGDGLDPHGFGITDGAYDNTTGAFTFTATAKTTSWTPEGWGTSPYDKWPMQCPDVVYLKTGTGGSFSARRARILAKVSASEFALEAGLFSGNVTTIGTSSGPMTTFADMETHLEVGNNRWAMVKAGTTITNSTVNGIGINSGDVVCRYGSGARPIFERGATLTDPSHGLLNTGGSGRACQQFIGLAGITGSGGVAGRFILLGTANSAQRTCDAFVYDCDFNTNDAPVWVQNYASRCIQLNNTYDGATTASGMIFADMYRDGVFMGNTRRGGTSASALVHGVYPSIKDGDKGGIISYNDFETSVAGGMAGHGININLSDADLTDAVQSTGWLVRGNRIGTGYQNGIDMSHVDNQSLDGRGSEIVVEKNTILADKAIGTPRAFSNTGAEKIVFRRNWIGSNTIERLVAFDGGGVVKNYRPKWHLNKVYLGHATSTLSAMVQLDVAGYSAGAELYKNDFFRASNAGHAASYVDTSETAWTLTDNEWHNPNKANPFRNTTAGTDSDLATFNADLSASDTAVASFAWLGPTIGDFSLPAVITRSHRFLNPVAIAGDVEADSFNGSAVSATASVDAIPKADEFGLLSPSWLRKRLSPADLSNVTGTTGSGSTLVKSEAPRITGAGTGNLAATFVSAATAGVPGGVDLRLLNVNAPGGESHVLFRLRVGVEGYADANLPAFMRVEAASAWDEGVSQDYIIHFTRPGGVDAFSIYPEHVQFVGHVFFDTIEVGGGLFRRGLGSPEGVVTAPVGSIYMRSDGGAATSVYFKESGAGNTGWVAK